MIFFLMEGLRSFPGQHLLQHQHHTSLCRDFLPLATCQSHGNTLPTSWTPTCEDFLACSTIAVILLFRTPWFSTFILQDISKESLVSLTMAWVSTLYLFYILRYIDVFVKVNQRHYFSGINPGDITSQTAGYLVSISQSVHTLGICTNPMCM